jgi:hypothetical protein
MDECKIKHLEFIQNVITRMNANSFQLKRMAIMIVAAFLAIYAGTSNSLFILVGIFPTLIFWFLDSYYLQQERVFRGIYSDVAGLKSRFEIRPFEMPIQKYNKAVDKSYSLWNVFTSKTIVGFYLPIIVVMLLLSGKNIFLWILK